MSDTEGVEIVTVVNIEQHTSSPRSDKKARSQISDTADEAQEPQHQQSTARPEKPQRAFDIPPPCALAYDCPNSSTNDGTPEKEKTATDVAMAVVLKTSHEQAEEFRAVSAECAARGPTVLVVKSLRGYQVSVGIVGLVTLAVAVVSAISYNIGSMNWNRPAQVAGFIFQSFTTSGP
jgi:hypothetical protein